MLFKNPNLLQEALGYKVDHQGICHLLIIMTKQRLITSKEAHLTGYFMRNYLRDINMFSGDMTYPIRCMLEHEYYAFIHHQDNETLWDKRHEYGRTRCELFEAIINNINANRKEPSDEAKACIYL